jgi:hypothetical protein
MPSPAEFFLAMFYLLIGSAILSFCIVMIGMAFVTLRKQWPK